MSGFIPPEETVPVNHILLRQAVGAMRDFFAGDPSSQGRLLETFLKLHRVLVEYEEGKRHAVS